MDESGKDCQLSANFSPGILAPGAPADDIAPIAGYRSDATRTCVIIGRHKKFVVSRFDVILPPTNIQRHHYNDRMRTVHCLSDVMMPVPSMYGDFEQFCA